MKPFKFLLPVLLTLVAIGYGLLTTACNPLTWRQTNRDDHLFVPQKADFRYVGELEFYPEYTVLVKEINYRDTLDGEVYAEDHFQFYLFWPDGNCLSTAVFDSLNADLNVYKQGYVGKYYLDQDTLYTEFFVGGSPNSYLYWDFAISENQTQFDYIQIQERMPGRKRFIKRKWMQERYDVDLYWIPADELKTLDWEPFW